MPARLPVLIFDFGNVVAFFDTMRACEALATPRGLSGPELLARAQAAGLDPLVRRYELGHLDDATFVQEAGRMAGITVDEAEFAAAWGDIFTPNEPIARLIEVLHGSGYTLLLGSNTSAIHARAFRIQFADLLARFDHLILSFEVGYAKPSAGFFRRCAEAAGVPESSCLFIDDAPSNVAGALAAGLTGILYRDPGQLVSALMTHGVQVNELA
jgi:putative hydrolase of the HAD superfamily